MDIGGRGGGRAGAGGIRLDFVGPDRVTFTGAVEVEDQYMEEVLGQQMDEDFYQLF